MREDTQRRSMNYIHHRHFLKAENERCRKRKAKKRKGAGKCQSEAKTNNGESSFKISPLCMWGQSFKLKKFFPTGIPIDGKSQANVKPKPEIKPPNNTTESASIHAEEKENGLANRSHSISTWKLWPDPDDGKATDPRWERIKGTGSESTLGESPRPEDQEARMMSCGERGAMAKRGIGGYLYVRTPLTNTQKLCASSRTPKNKKIKIKIRKSQRFFGFLCGRRKFGSPEWFRGCFGFLAASNRWGVKLYFR